MNKKILALAILMSTSQIAMAEQQESSHNEATSGGVGLVVGALAGGPIGAIIGGSFGVMTGHNQTKTETINDQQQAITDLETELNQMMSKLSQSKVEVQTLESEHNILKRHYITDLAQFADGYQFDIYFLTNSDTLHPQAQKGLEKLTYLLQQYPTLQANIEAYSDWRGTEDKNFLLANQRLITVNDYIVGNGIKQSQLISTNYGENNAYNNASWGEELFYDRRVTISLNYFE